MSETTKKPSDRIVEIRNDILTKAGVDVFQGISVDSRAILDYLDEQHERAVKQVESKEVCHNCKEWKPCKAHDRKAEQRCEVGEVEVLISQLKHWWSFDENQKPTNSYRDRQKYIDSVFKQLLKRPAKEVKYPEHKPMDYMNVNTFPQGWNACIEEMKRLNAESANTKELVELDENALLSKWCEECQGIDRNTMRHIIHYQVMPLINSLTVPKKRLSVEEIREICLEEIAKKHCSPQYDAFLLELVLNVLHQRIYGSND